MSSNKVKNPCKICRGNVTQKTGLKCMGACKKWAHYKCLNYTPGKISDIKAGITKIKCPCPNCDTPSKNSKPPVKIKLLLSCPPPLPPPAPPCPPICPTSNTSCPPPPQSCPPPPQSCPPPPQSSPPKPQTSPPQPQTCPPPPQSCPPPPQSCPPPPQSSPPKPQTSPPQPQTCPPPPQSSPPKPQTSPPQPQTCPPCPPPIGKLLKILRPQQQSPPCNQPPGNYTIGNQQRERSAQYSQQRLKPSQQDFSAYTISSPVRTSSCSFQSFDNEETAVYHVPCQVSLSDSQMSCLSNKYVPIVSTLEDMCNTMTKLTAQMEDLMARMVSL